MMLRPIVLPVAALCLLLASASAQDDVKERVKIAKALGEQGSTVLPELRKMLKDPEYKVRLQAVKSIVRIDTIRSLDALIEATRDADPEIQVRAVNGLVNFYLPGYVERGLGASLKKLGDSIEGYFSSGNDPTLPPGIKVREDVVVAIGKIASGGSSTTSRANAAFAVGVLRGHAAVPDLLKAVKSKDSAVIYESLIALQKIGDKSAAPGVAFLLRDLDDRVQIAAIETTGLLQNRDALPQLYDALNDARNKKIRRAALSAIAMLPDERSRVYYNQYITDKDPLLRAAAAEGFGRLLKASDLRMMQDFFDKEKKMNPRLSMAFALVLLGRTDLSEFSPLRYLINTLNSASFHGVAQPFLVELAREQAVRESIYKALSGATKDEKIYLAQVLARSGDAASVPHLETLTKDPDVKVATEAARALTTLKTRLG